MEGGSIVVGGVFAAWGYLLFGGPKFARDCSEDRRYLFHSLDRIQRQPKGQKLQLKQTSDATSLLLLCCRTSVSHCGKGNLDVASRAPRDEGRIVVVALSTLPKYLWMSSKWPWKIAFFF